MGLAASAAASAEEINLLCMARNGQVCQLYVDTQQRYLTYCQDEYEEGVNAKVGGKQFVQIDGANIRFGDQETRSALNRYTGILSIEMNCTKAGSDGCALQFGPVACRKAEKKF